jgi:glutamine amidotransferase
MSKSIQILNLGIGNLRSIQRILKTLNEKVSIIDETSQYDKKSIIVLPGVGRFASAMTKIKNQSWDEILKLHAQQGNGLLGICLGMQLMGIKSEENLESTGLGIFNYESVKISNRGNVTNWIEITDNNSKEKVFEIENESFYFNHNFGIKDIKTNFDITYETTCNNRYYAILGKENNIGIQFHPEKSQVSGFKLLAKTIKYLND